MSSVLKVFIPNGNMLNVMTNSLAASAGINVLGVLAGVSTTSLGAPLAQNRHIALRMRVREVGNPGSEVDAGTCFHVAIENTLYDGVAKGGSWVPSAADDQLGVCSVDAPAPVQRVRWCEHGLDVVFTTAHANLGAVSSL